MRTQDEEMERVEKPAVLAFLLSAVLIMSVPVIAEEVPEQEQPDISETVPMAVSMTDAVEALAWPYYNSSAKVAQDSPDNGRDYTDHKQGHALMVADKSLEAGRTLWTVLQRGILGGEAAEGEISLCDQIDWTVLEAAALFHDTGMSDGGAASVINDTASDDPGSEEEFTEIEGRTVQGPETVDVGEFVVDVPKGWLGVHELDWDTLEGDGPVEFATNQYEMVKGGQTSQDITIDSPNIDIWYTVEDSVETLLETIDYMDEIIELDLELEGKECKAVHTVLNLEDQGPDESDMVFFPLSDSSCLRVIINTNGGGVDTGLSIEDSDVLAILNSIQIK